MNFIILSLKIYRFELIGLDLRFWQIPKIAKAKGVPFLHAFVNLLRREVRNKGALFVICPGRRPNFDALQHKPVCMPHYEIN